ncbi:homeobox domain-containing protein Ecym_2247 [Eremothecium cymbalariae DBVPG|uniref:Homeobox domain-containing protein n=1 Tax=Eremothecium cymbalariae (strain CBS 270.75 / DBVPG 7215 / KCTC 17166 / NRRL Y-17582) TaxID=931890 RepID=G8JPN8_ERECY|nr:Hypothetical protein Ecym_2247 [Eremothecium cymbalariae DBVPG\
MPNPPVKLPSIHHILNIVDIVETDQYRHKSYPSVSPPISHSPTRGSSISAISEFNLAPPQTPIFYSGRVRSPSLPQIRSCPQPLPRHHSISHFQTPYYAVTPKTNAEATSTASSSSAPSSAFADSSEGHAPIYYHQVYQTTAVTPLPFGIGGVAQTSPVFGPQSCEIHYTLEPHRDYVPKQIMAPSTTTATTVQMEPISASQAGTAIPKVPHKALKSVEHTKKQHRRSNLPKETVDILNEWLRDHYDNPYPSPQEKKELLKQTGLNPVQLSNWFINVRRRKIFQNYYKLSKSYSGNITSQSHAEPPRGAIEEARSDSELDKRFNIVPLTRRKKLIDRLEELKNLSGTNV